MQFIDNLNLERGLSSFDQRNNLQTTFLLSSPVGVHGLLRNGGWAERTLTGWTVSGTFTAASGTPLTALVAGNLSNTAGLAGSGSTRAEATGFPSPVAATPTSTWRHLPRLRLANLETPAETPFRDRFTFRSIPP
ncbi:MAG TPA: hypothetical protein VMR62_22270 [Bryobacteraceae bacterium]|nr:hypothetical protein [Bryobacteraceae bacterium]